MLSVISLIFLEYATGNYSIEIPPTTVRPTQGQTEHSDTMSSNHGSVQDPHVYVDPESTGRRPSKARRPKGKHNRNSLGRPTDVENIDMAHDTRGNVVYVEGMSDSVREVMESNYDDDVTTQKNQVDLYKETNKRMEQRNIAVIIGVLLALILMLIAVSVFVYFLHRRRKMNNNHQSLKIVQTHNSTLGTLDLSSLHHSSMTAKLSGSQVYNYVTDSPASTAKDTYDLLTQRKLPDIPPPTQRKYHDDEHII